MTEIHAFDPDGTPSPGALLALDAAVDGIDTDAQVAAVVGDDTTEAGTLVRDMFPSTTRGNLDIYVDTGGDDDGDGTETSPLRTLARAMASIPDTVRADHTVKVHIGEGEWTEDLVLTNRQAYGSIIIQGSTGDRANHKVHRINCERLFGTVTIRHLTTTKKDNTGPSIRFESCAPYIVVQDVLTEPGPGETEGGSPGGVAVVGLLADHGSAVRVLDSEFSEKRYGLRSNYLSRIFSQNNTGEGNHRGLGARFGGIVAVHGSQPDGATPYSVTSGGLIVRADGGEIGPASEVANEVGLSARYETRPGFYGRKVWAFRSDTPGVDIPSTGIDPGQRIRFHFRAGGGGTISANVGFSYVGVVNTTSRYVRKEIVGRITASNAHLDTMTMVHDTPSTHDPAEIIQTSHAGEGPEFFIDAVPYGDDGIRNLIWGVDIDISSYTRFAAPTLLGIEVVESATD